MVPLLLDEGLYPVVAKALSAVGLDVWAVGDPDAPPRNSSDEENCRWCADHGAVLVTNDRGKKDPTIFEALNTFRVHAIFVHDDLRRAPPHHLLRALLKAEGAIDQHTRSGRQLLRRRLRPGGGLERR